MKTITYLGNVGSEARNDAGAWTAPGLPETPAAPHSRAVEDALADTLIASGCFEEASRKTSREVLAEKKRVAAEAKDATP